MTTSIFTGLIIKSAWTPGLNGGSFPKLISKHCMLGSLCACAVGLILTPHIWAPACAVPWTSVGLFPIRIWWIPHFPMYHPQIIYKNCDSSAVWFTGICKLCEGEFTLGPPLSQRPIASNSCPICFLYPHCFRFLPTLGSALPSSPMILCGLWEAIWGCIFKCQCFLRNTQYMQKSKLTDFFLF